MNVQKNDVLQDIEHFTQLLARLKQRIDKVEDPIKLSNTEDLKSTSKDEIINKLEKDVIRLRNERNEWRNRAISLASTQQKNNNNNNNDGINNNNKNTTPNSNRVRGSLSESPPTFSRASNSPSEEISSSERSPIDRVRPIIDIDLHEDFGGCEGGVVCKAQEGRLVGERSKSSLIHKSPPLKVNDEQRTPFQLMVCTDEECEFVTPEGNEISTKHLNSNMIKFVWEAKPRNVLLVKKPNDAEALDVCRAVAQWYHELGMFVWMEEEVVMEMQMPFINPLKSHSMNLRQYHVTNHIDLCITMGGDGTCLWAQKLFQRSVPPFLSLALGSLGFLTLFNPDDFKDHLSMANAGNFYLSLRTRLTCHILRSTERNASLRNLNHLDVTDHQHHDNAWHVLNEVTIDRGPSGSLVNLDCFCNDEFVTKVQGDGLIVATSTGSTAYSLAAGGSMVHPSVPSMVFTPICPHSLSFRPIILPDSVTVRINIPLDSRCSAWASFDGQNKQELRKGDSLVIKVSRFPVPVICKNEESIDWYHAATSVLGWNVREAQKPHNFRKKTVSSTNTVIEEEEVVSMDKIETPLLNKKARPMSVFNIKEIVEQNTNIFSLPEDLSNKDTNNPF